MEDLDEMVSNDLLHQHSLKHEVLKHPRGVLNYDENKGQLSNSGLQFVKMALWLCTANFLWLLYRKQKQKKYTV